MLTQLGRADWRSDRTNLGNARTLNNDKPGHSLVETLDLQGDRYLLVVAIFFMYVSLGHSIWLYL